MARAQSFIRLSIVGKAAIAVVAFARALGGVAAVAALATRGRDAARPRSRPSSPSACKSTPGCASPRTTTVREDDRAYRSGQDAFVDAMQVTETEHEAHALLEVHIERWAAEQRRRPQPAPRRRARGEHRDRGGLAPARAAAGRGRPLVPACAFDAAPRVGRRPAAAARV
jgi:hypothetical protein